MRPLPHYKPVGAWQHVWLDQATMGAREERYPIVLAELHFEQHSLTLELFPVYYI